MRRSANATSKRAKPSASTHELKLMVLRRTSFQKRISIATNIIVLSNHGKKNDWFDRPDQRHMLDNIRNRTDLTEQEKDELIKNVPYGSFHNVRDNYIEWKNNRIKCSIPTRSNTNRTLFSPDGSYPSGLRRDQIMLGIWIMSM